ncbi:MAG: MarC family protein [Bradymonadales bacterium]|nr:MAG: MarC family protein [Bradymonadales bacterium]
MDDFLSAFVPLFVAIDAIGIVAIYMGLTQDLSMEGKKRLLREAVLTALGISILFLLFGKAIFQLLGITSNDFRIAGGVVLFTFAIVDLLFSRPERKRAQTESVGVVPIGIPLIMGPAALTTILISVEAVGLTVTSISLIVNLAIVYLVFRNADWIVKVMGVAGSKAVAKVMSLFLAAIAVMMIRMGVLGVLEEWTHILG